MRLLAYCPYHHKETVIMVYESEYVHRKARYRKPGECAIPFSLFSSLISFLIDASLLGFKIGMLHSASFPMMCMACTVFPRLQTPFSFSLTVFVGHVYFSETRLHHETAFFLVHALRKTKYCLNYKKFLPT